MIGDLNMLKSQIILLSNFLIKIKRIHLFYELLYNMPPTFYVAWDTGNLVLRTKKHGTLLIGCDTRFTKNISHDRNVTLID